MRLSDPTFGDLADLRKKMVVWAKGMDRANAEDLVQTAMLKMCAGRHLAPAVPAQIEPWAYVVLLNVFRGERRRNKIVHFDALDDVILRSPDNPETTTYCRQVFAMLGLDGALLLAEPESPQTPTQRTQRRRARLKLERVAA